MAESTVGATIEVFTVRIGGLRCGFAALDVVGVYPAVRPHPLPGAPAIVEGIVNVRGRIVPLVDLRGRLGLPPEPVRARQHLVVVQGAGRHLAFLVDRAESLEAIPADAVDTTRLEGRPPMPQGIARRSDGLLLIYDPSRFLGPADAVDFDAALAAWERAAPA